LQRAAIRSLNVSICASGRSRCQLIVGPPKLRLSQSGGRKSHRLWQPSHKRLPEATADVISSTTREQTIAALLPLLAKGSRAISMHSGQVAASGLMVAA
jgi:hypothetical protein